MAAKFGIQAKNVNRQALIVELGEQRLGVLVDTVSEVLRLQDSAIEGPPALAAAG